MTKLKETWSKFESFLKSKGKTMGELGFRPGAKDEDISKLEIRLSTNLPADYKDFLLICNGQKALTLDWLPDHMTLFGVKEVAETYEYELSRMPLVGEHTYNTFHFHDKIRSIIFHHQRIPIAQYEVGACEIYIDNIPAPKGTDGQLIFNATEADFIVLAKTLTSLISTYVTLLNNGKLIFTDAPKGSESKYVIQTASGKPINGDVWLELIG